MKPTDPPPLLKVSAVMISVELCSMLCSTQYGADRFKLHPATDGFPDALAPSYVKRSDWNSRERVLIIVRQDLF